MAEARDKKAMSLALGAAFLNHQVEQLQKSVSTRPQPGQGLKMNYARAVDPRESQGRPILAPALKSVRNEAKPQSVPRESSTERNEKSVPTKDADIVVVDSSVLVRGIAQLKAWCRDGREEVIIVPLEVLNTLDLLKKGTSSLAQRARMASRILEQQVGTNPRIRVQRDEAYVPWDDIAFTDSEKSTEDLKQSSDDTPEWLRRTVSCARWELNRAKDSMETPPNAPVDPAVVVAVCLEPAQQHEPNSVLSDPAEASPVPVPLRAPQPPSKHEQRCSGSLVAQWAKYSGVRVLECRATPLSAPTTSGPRHGQGHHGRGRSASSDEEWRATVSASQASPPRPVSNHSRNASTPQRPKFGSFRGKNGLGPSVGDPKRVASSGSNVFGPGRAGVAGGLVERPAATMAMNASMLQTSKPIRVLARGEKLEP